MVISGRFRYHTLVRKFKETSPKKNNEKQKSGGFSNGKFIIKERLFQSYITAIDHWIAFILLVLIGGKMILDVVKEKGENEEVCPEGSVRIDLREFFLLAIATSIDALAIGITFAFLQVRLITSVTIIGCITFCFSIVGVLIGNVFGSKFKDKATILGGIILIGIGVKILIEHLGLFG